MEAIGFAEGCGMSERESTLVLAVARVGVRYGVGDVAARGTRCGVDKPRDERSLSERGAP